VNKAKATAKTKANTGVSPLRRKKRAFGRDDRVGGVVVGGGGGISWKF
jgi:hypothetical protein